MKTYKLNFGCYNCYHKWTREIPFGQDVEEGAIAGYLKIGREAITCPNCGSRKTHKTPKEYLKVL